MCPLNFFSESIWIERAYSGISYEYYKLYFNLFLCYVSPSMWVIVSPCKIPIEDSTQSMTWIYQISDNKHDSF
jgi:hypothetical protein